jgi:hypothetical protein
MSTIIDRLLGIDLPEDLYPAARKFQEIATAALEAYADDAGDTPMADALALALFELEKSHANTKGAVAAAATLILNLRAYVVNLETRLLEAGVPLGLSEYELEPVEDLVEFLDEMRGT